MEKAVRSEGFTDSVRHLFRRVYKERGWRRADRLRIPMSVHPRVRVDEDGEGWREYGIIPADLVNEAEGDIDGWLWSLFGVEIHSPYDCTGMPFTVMIDWHLNPDGSVSFVHWMSLDV